jgi:hypothetical protein
MKVCSAICLRIPSGICIPISLLTSFDRLVYLTMVPLPSLLGDSWYSFLKRRIGLSTLSTFTLWEA